MCKPEEPCRDVLLYATERALAAQPLSHAQSEAALLGLGAWVHESVQTMHRHMLCGALLPVPEASRPAEETPR